MQLHVDFDDNLIRRYVGRGKSPIFTIYWTQDQVAYPEDQWLDAGSVILSWWLVAAKSLLEGAVEADFDFMDGPFRLKARRSGASLYVSADDQPWQWPTPMGTFINELLRATKQVQQELDRLGVSDTEKLQDGTRRLRSAMSNAKKKAIGSHAPVVKHVA